MERQLRACLSTSDDKGFLIYTPIITQKPLHGVLFCPEDEKDDPHVLALDGFSAKATVYITLYCVTNNHTYTRLVTFKINPATLEFTKPRRALTPRLNFRVCNRTESPRNYKLLAVKEKKLTVELMYVAKKYADEFEKKEYCKLLIKRIQFY